LQDDGRESIYYANPPRLELGGTGLIWTLPSRTRRPSPFATGRSSRPACPPKPPRLLIGIYIFRKQARVAVGP
jgi:hypothetical protein